LTRYRSDRRHVLRAAFIIENDGRVAALRGRTGPLRLELVYFSPVAVFKFWNNLKFPPILQVNHFKIQQLYRFKIRQIGSFSWQSLRTPGNKAGRIINRFS
jgi:hypothetical protein